MDIIKLQEKALLMMKRRGEVEWRNGLNGKYMLHSVPEPEKKERKKLPQMELQQGFD